MKMTNKKRYLIVMLICVLLNEGLGELDHLLDLPVWYDFTGTALAAIILEPAAGLIVGLLNNFYLAVFVYGKSALLYYAVSAVIALIVGINMRPHGKLEKKRILSTMLYVLLATSILSSAITLWETGGVSSDPWELYYYNMALAAKLPEYVACFLGVFIVKIYDILLTTATCCFLYAICPNSLKYPPQEVPQLQD